ncbi:hypothetical protein ACFPRL_27110 [Pseudoclavibacter helvolus]
MALRRSRPRLSALLAWPWCSPLRRGASRRRALSTTSCSRRLARRSRLSWAAPKRRTRRCPSSTTSPATLPSPRACSSRLSSS